MEQKNRFESGELEYQAPQLVLVDAKFSRGEDEVSVKNVSEVEILFDTEVNEDEVEDDE